MIAPAKSASPTDATEAGAPEHRPESIVVGRGCHVCLSQGRRPRCVCERRCSEHARAIDPRQRGRHSETLTAARRTRARVETLRNLSVARVMLRAMTDATPDERCACPETHPTVDGQCIEPSVRSEDPSDPTLAKYAWCGCCMADCPDVHPDSDSHLQAIPGSTVIAEEYVNTLPADKQQKLRELAARGDLRITPQS